MEDGEIATVAECAEQRAFRIARIGEGGKRLVGVASHHHMVEPLRAAAHVDHRHTGAVAFDRADTAVAADAIGERLRQALDVGAAAARDGLPCRPVAKLQQAMIFVKADERRGRIGHHLGGRRRPDGARHRQQMVVAEGIAVAALTEIVAEADLFGLETGGIARCLAVEPRQVGQHRPESRPQDIRRLAEQPPEAGARILQGAVVHRDREGHVRGAGRHAEQVEQRREVRIRLAVEDDEAGVDRNAAAADRRHDRVGMPADPVGALEDGDVVALIQQPGRGEAGDSGANDGHL